MSLLKYESEPNTLAIERIIDAPRAIMWRCWTDPDLLKEWFCPKPWRVPEADFDLRPGGRMNTVMEGPNGERMENSGIFLEIKPFERLTFTDAYRENFVPAESSFMTGFVELSDADNGKTRMVWGARHSNEDDKKKHLEMGYEKGWDVAASQLDELAQSIAKQDPADGAPLHFKSKIRTCIFLNKEAEEAARFYVSLLPDSEIEAVYNPDPAGPALVVEFRLAGTAYMSMNGNPDPQSSHVTSISVLTKDQSETDHLWDALIADGGEEGPCGWLKDKFGVHWQIAPEALPRLLHAGDTSAANRVSGALMKMKKIEISTLEAAFQNQ